METGGGAAASVELVLPCLNEADALPWVLERVPDGVGVIVVDNGSTDATASVASSWGALVVAEDQPGYGAACHAGLVAASADVVVVMDADASVDPGDLMSWVQPLLRGDADLVVGSRCPTDRRAWPWHLRLANAEVARRLARRTGVRLTDLGPMRAAARESLLDLKIRDRRSGYPLETVVRAADAGWRVVGVDIDYHPRVGRSKVTGTPWGAAIAVRDMTRVLAR